MVSLRASEKRRFALIRRYMTPLRLGLMVVDGVSAALVFLLASIARFGDGQWMEIWRGLGFDIRVVAAAFGITWVAALWYHGLYQLRTRWRLRSEALEILRATVLVAAFSLSALFIFHQDGVSRLFLIILFTVQPIVTFIGRALLRAWFTSLRQRGRNPHFMLVVGTGPLARDFADRVERRAALGIRVIGHLAEPAADIPGDLRRPILGSIEEMGRVLAEDVVDEVAVCLEPEYQYYRDLVVRLAVDQGKAVRVPVDPIAAALPNSREEEFEGYVVRSLVFDEGHEASLAVKRVVDIAGSLAGLVVLSPVVLVVALAILVMDGRPIHFHQARIGLHGRPFTVHKFRTMVSDAEAHLAEIRHLNERNGIVFKATDDPRVTRLGRTLRATSIDELPQLWNVLKGEMSLVGPRPSLVAEVAEYGVWHRRRLSMKPGITGLWQVEARHEPEFDRWVERDLAYIDRWSLLLDLRILLRTVPAVLGRTGK
jgi:exopolysaccharide biosynthesis polyprenyl glycosylphosphotransferase